MHHVALRHPLLRSRVDPGPPLVWRADTTYPELIQVADQLPSHVPPIDLTREAGCRAFLQSSAGQSELLFQLHHAACDGAAGIQAIREVLIAYTNACQALPLDTGLPALNVQLLARRNQLGLSSRSYWKHWYKQPLAAFGAAKFLTRSCAVLNHPSPASDPQCFPAIDGCWLNPDQVALIESRARSLGIRANSILMGCLFIALDEWSREVLGTSGEPWLRMLLPINLRERKHARMPAANRTTLVQLDRRRRQWESGLEGFFHYLNREVDIIRNWKFDRLFLVMIRIMGIAPGWLERSAGRDHSRGTAIFTHLGEPFRWARRRTRQSADQRTLPIANLTLTEFDWVGPIRPGTPFNLSVQRMGNHLRLSVHWDPRQLARSDMEWIVARYCDRLANLE